MKIDLPKSVVNILKTLTRSGHEAYVVGGAVRDVLLAKPVDDWDFTTNATPKEIQKIFPDSFYDNKFGTVGIKIKDYENPFEITTFRTEKNYSDTRRPDKVVWGETLKEDVKRRDFTVNAMAIVNTNEDNDYKLIDYFNGQKDLENKLIRAVGNANERFGEDALRMMRAVRIAGELGFSIEDSTLEAIKNNAKLISKIAPERVKDELFKLLASKYPYEGMLLVKNTGLMDVILPELSKTFGVEQKSPGRHHIYDVGTHCFLSLKHVADKNEDPLVRFATLIHDIGKPQTYKKLDSGVVTFYNHEVTGARIAKRIAERFRFSNKEKGLLWILVRHHQFTVDEFQTDKALRRFIRKVGLENVPDILDLRTGDRLGSGSRETSWRTEEFKSRLVEVQKQPFGIHDLKIKGDDVMKELNLSPGPKVGNILKQLFDKVEDKEIPNEKKELLKVLSKLKLD